MIELCEILQRGHGGYYSVREIGVKTRDELVNVGGG